MGTVAGTRLSMCMKPQQTAETSTPHYLSKWFSLDFNSCLHLRKTTRHRSYASLRWMQHLQVDRTLQAPKTAVAVQERSPGLIITQPLTTFILTVEYFLYQRCSNGLCSEKTVIVARYAWLYTVPASGRRSDCTKCGGAERVGELIRTMFRECLFFKKSFDCQK